MEGKLVSAVEWWKENGKWTCSLVCYDGAFNQIWLEPGINLSFKIQPGRYCIGYTTLSSLASKTRASFEPWKAMEPCPTKAKLEKGYQCSSCYRKDIVHPCLICDGTKCLAKSSSIQMSCQKATAYVYIASFGSSQVKVGAVHDTRVPLRWIEQGANMAKRVIIGNGIQVRRFEKAIHNALNVLPGLRTRKKVDTLWRTRDANAEIDALTRTEEEIKNGFPKLPFYQESIHDLSGIYDLPDLDRRPIELEVKEELQVSGKILGVKGSLLLLGVGDLPYIIALDELLGRKIELIKAEAIVMQTALDRF